MSLHLYSDMSLPHLGFAWYSSPMTTPRNPFPTVDVIIELEDGGIVLIRRKNPPPGWALRSPGPVRPLARMGWKSVRFG